MKAAVGKIKSALSRQGIVKHLGYYLVKGGYIHASDGRMIAATPFASDAEFLVPGPEFEAVLDRMPEPILSDVLSDSIIIKSGRLRGSIKTLPIGFVEYTPPDPTWEIPPATFLDALKLAAKFISDNATQPFALAAALCDGAILATNNVVLVSCICPGLKGASHLLPCWAVQLLLAHPSPLTGLQLTENAASFLWEDRSWLQTKLIDAKFPDVAASMLAELIPATHEIQLPWRLAFETLEPVCGTNVLEVSVDNLRGTLNEATLDCAVESMLPAGAEKTYWDTRYLGPMLELATHWQMDAWPRPASFHGPGIKGVIMGRLRW